MTERCKSYIFIQSVLTVIWISKKKSYIIHLPIKEEEGTKELMLMLFRKRGREGGRERERERERGHLMERTWEWKCQSPELMRALFREIQNSAAPMTNWTCRSFQREFWKKFFFFFSTVTEQWCIIGTSRDVSRRENKSLPCFLSQRYSSMSDTFRFQPFPKFTYTLKGL